MAPLLMLPMSLRNKTSFYPKRERSFLQGLLWTISPDRSGCAPHPLSPFPSSVEASTTALSAPRGNGPCASPPKP